ncbi:P-loop NTPase fold protein [Candidatus Merdisoma sp. JLR.KK011]|uniref:P-loop NTPase fold protein n=1 Tax=Candidatus Merdisoma sp. JLR.KK011 TaxID=3114299 RepID=UPI002FEEEC27
MKYADRVSEIINAFSPEPLKIEQMEDFYCKNTMEYRMSDKYSSPMEDIFDICQDPREQNACLLLGHRGCGKSTELNRMSEELKKKGYQVKTITCSMDLDLFNIVYSDLFILMGEALLELADESGCRMDRVLLEEIEHFWIEGEEITTSQEITAASLETGITAETPGILAKVLKLFAKMKTDLKFNEETRKEYRNKISIRSSEWIEMLSRVSEMIAAKLGGKRPIIIFEDLDKLNPEDAWKVFYHYAAVLSGMSFPVIYTFPIGLSYDARFSAMESYFITKTLPMIKIETIEGQPFEDGIAVIREIVEKRTDLKLFEDKVLEELILYTGGSLRDLFHAINAAAKRAERRSSEVIAMEDARRALEELKTSLTRRIEKKDYDFLRNIYSGNKELIEDKEMLLRMLQASVVLEYNGKRWHNVHPLVIRFLKEQGL